MRVTILHYAGPPVVGGVEVTIYHHARWLAEHGHEVTVVAGRGDTFHPQVRFRRVPEVDSRHPDVLAVGKALAKGQVPDAFSALTERIVDLLRPILRETEVAVVHNALTLHKNLPLTAALYRLNEEQVTPLVAWCHDFAWLDDLYVPDLHPGYPWDLLRTRWPGVRYVVVSHHRRQQLAELLDMPEDEIAVVPPGVDVAGFFKWEPETRRLVEQLRLLEAEPILLLPARVTRRKNIEFAIRVVGALREAFPRCALVVTGPPGPHNPTNVAYLNRLRELAAELGVQKNVVFLYEHGPDERPLHVTDAMMSDFYQLADVLLFPSKREGFGIPVLEAGLARIPIFAADIPPVRESAGPWAVRFDPDGDPHPVAEAIIQRLQADPVYQMRRRVLREYTWDRIMTEKVVPLLQDWTYRKELPAVGKGGE